MSVDETPGPDHYFYEDLHSSLNGPKFSFSKLRRDFKSFFGEDSKFEKRKESMKIPKVNLDKYKTEKIIDTSAINERNIK